MGLSIVLLKFLYLQNVYAKGLRVRNIKGIRLFAK